FASHAHGPDEAHEELARSDRAVGTLFDAAGGPEEFLERYAVILCADHGQTRVSRAVPLERAFAGLDAVVVTASNRAGMVYRLPGCAEEAHALAVRLDAEPAAEIVLYREAGESVARREGEELRFARGPAGWTVSGDAAILDVPDGLERAWAALHNPNAGDLIVSAAPDVEFSDLAGRHHAGGGSHGSLVAGDSEVPMLTLGLEPEPLGITDVAPLALSHFGIAPPPYARQLARAA
ncbi:MAG: alkaline phosphatase family protein, partial [Gaiellaceae bacterium]